MVDVPRRSVATASRHDERAHALAAELRHSVTRLARRLRQQDRSGLGPTLTATLATIHRHGSPSHGELAAAEGLTAPTITAAVDKLVGIGLVERVTDTVDRRVTRVVITPQGVDQLDSVRERRTEWLEAQLRSLSADELERLAAAIDVLQRLTELPDALPAEDAR